MTISVIDKIGSVLLQDTQITEDLKVFAKTGGEGMDYFGILPAKVKILNGSKFHCP